MHPTYAEHTYTKNKMYKPHARIFLDIFRLVNCLSHAPMEFISIYTKKFTTDHNVCQNKFLKTQLQASPNFRITGQKHFL